MKLEINKMNKEGDSLEYIDVNFWSFFQMVFVTQVVITGMWLSLIVAIGIIIGLVGG